MKKRILALAFMALPFTAAQAKPDLTGLSKDVQIMTGILQTALKQQMDRQGTQIRDIDASYFAGQGVVFEMGTNHGRWNFSFDFGDLLAGLPVPVPPAPPVGSEIEVDVFSFDDHESIREFTEEAMEHAHHALREAKERLRDLKEDERELGWEAREIARRKKDIDFEMRRADKDRKKDLQERLRELEKEEQELKKKQAEVNKYAENLEKETKEKQAKQQAAKEKQQKRFLASFEGTIADSLCRYGAGLKSLPNNEKINFVLKGIGAVKDNRRNVKQDRVYVFNNKDVKDCVTGKLDGNKLLTRANVYMF